MNPTFFVLVICLGTLRLAYGGLSRCSARDAEKDGDYTCFGGCNTNSIYNGYRYCLNYLPNNGGCYLEPLDRDKMFTCHGRYSSTSRNHWHIFIGGSNQYMMMKTMLDTLLEIPTGSVFTPEDQWNSSVPNDSELPLMDFIWDADHNSIKRRAFDWYQGKYNFPPEMVEIYMDVPTVSDAGSFRVSYANLHTADQFIARFENIVHPNSTWLPTNPIIDIYFEWSGRWGDWWVDENVHSQNLEYLNSRIANEGLDIRTFVASDSAFGCDGTSSTKTNLVAAYEATTTPFEKFYFSKSEMAKNQQDLSGFCMTNGHALRPLDKVALMRYFNMICPVEEANDEEPSEEEALPICLQIQNPDECFFASGDWASNLLYVCEANVVDVAPLPANQYCPYDGSNVPALPTCKATNGAGVVQSLGGSGEGGDWEGGGDGLEGREEEVAFTVMAYLGVTVAFAYLLYESWQEHAKALPKPSNTSKDKSVDEPAVASTKVAAAPPESSEQPDGVRKLSSFELDVASPVEPRSECGDNNPSRKGSPTASGGSDDVTVGIGAVNGYDCIVQDLEGDVEDIESRRFHGLGHPKAPSGEVVPAPSASLLSKIQEQEQEQEHEGVEMMTTQIKGRDEEEGEPNGGTNEQERAEIHRLSPHGNQVYPLSSVATQESMRVVPQNVSVKGEHPSTFHAMYVYCATAVAQLVSVVPLLSTYFYFPAAISNNTTRFDSISFARFLASVHIVLGHCYQGGQLDEGAGGFNKFGFTWVPWFFMLSGFILTISEQKRRKKPAGKIGMTDNAPSTNNDVSSPSGAADTGKEKSVGNPAESANGAPTTKDAPSNPRSAVSFLAFLMKDRKHPPLFEYVMRRLETMYPTYIVGIFVAVVTAWSMKGAAYLQPPAEVLLYYFLVQSWVPSILEYGLLYLVQCWFMSCLLFYWCIFFHVFDVLDYVNSLPKYSKQTMIAITLTCSVALPLFYQLVTFDIEDWYNKHTYLSTDQAVDVATTTLKYHPLAYLHIFVLGCCLPYIRNIVLEVASDRDHKLNKYVVALVPYISIASYGILLIIFCTAGDDVPGYKLSFRLGLISIVQSSLLVGLTIGEDWLARLFTHPFFTRFGLYSFPQYVFQFIVLAWFNFATGGGQVDFRYFAMLFATSVCVWNGVKQFNGKNMTTFVKLTFPFLIIYLMLQPFIANYQGGADDSVSFPSWWKDSPLSIQVDNVGYGPGFQSERFIFNPSLMMSDVMFGQNFVVARRTYHKTEGFSWSDGGDYMVQRYYTDILIGEYKTSSSVEVSVVTANIKPCMPDFTCNSNGTLTGKIISAPEDGRLFRYRGQLFVSFFSYDNILDPDVPEKALSTYEGDFGSGTDICIPDAFGLIGRMYIGRLYDVPLTPCVMNPELSPVRQRGIMFKNNSIVKNWLVFTSPPTYSAQDPEAQQLFFIHSIAPRFMIMGVEEGGEVEVGAFGDGGTVMTSVAYDHPAPRGILQIYDEAKRQMGEPLQVGVKGQTESQSSRSSARRLSHVNSTRLEVRSRRRYPSISSVDLYCPGQFTHAPDGPCYYVPEVTGNYATAQQTCAELGGWVATIRTAESNEYVVSLLQERGTGSAYMGLNDIQVEGTYAWEVDQLPPAQRGNAGGSTSFTNFWDGEPNDWGGNEDCGEIRDNGFWNDNNCGLGDYHFVCEAPTTFEYSPTFAPTQMPQGDDMDENPVHGSVNPVFISASLSPVFQKDYYLSIFHTVTQPGKDSHYAPYPFMFCPSAPFTLAAYFPRPIPLATTPSCSFGFVSGLTLDWCSGASKLQGGEEGWGQGEACVVLTYGLCDQSSRVAYVQLRKFEEQMKVVAEC